MSDSSPAIKAAEPGPAYVKVIEPVLPYANKDPGYGTPENDYHSHNNRRRDSRTRTPSPDGSDPHANRDNNRNATMSLIVRGLSFDTSPARVRRFFEQCGEIRDVYLPCDYHTGRPKGFGFVEFADPKDAETALRDLSETELDGKRITLSVAQHGRKSPDTMRRRQGSERTSGRRGRDYFPSRNGGPDSDRYRGPYSSQRSHSRNASPCREYRSRAPRSYGRDRIDYETGGRWEDRRRQRSPYSMRDEGPRASSRRYSHEDFDSRA